METAERMTTAVWDRDMIEALFTTSSWPRRGGPGHAEQLAEALNAGKIAVSRRRIYETAPLPLDASWQERAIHVRAADRGGEWHSTAKYWAWHWLRSQGEPGTESTCGGQHSK
jgi:hypothetical protein